MDARPPMDPSSDEADERQLALAREQGDAYGRALAHMTDEVAEDGGAARAGEYVVGYAVEEAEGMYAWQDDDLVWQEPGDENVHLEVAVRDGADGRFVPGLDVTATLVAPSGERLEPRRLPFLWHPMLHHYGCNLHAPENGDYTLEVHIEPPRFMRHDEINGRRFCDPVDVRFTGVRLATAGEDSAVG